jgi:hypothetical protein
MAAYFTDTLSADGQSDTFRIPGPSFTIAARGTFGSGTVKLQVSFDGTNWQDVTDGTTAASMTAAAQLVVDLGRLNPDHGYIGRFDLSGSTSPSLTVEVP